MHVGDWIEHMDSPATRGIVIEELGADLRVLVSGEEAPRVIGAADLHQWWEPLPTSTLDAPLPFWVKRGTVFVARDTVENAAQVHDVRPGWVAYWDHPRKSWTPMFMIARWSHFHEKWAPKDPPTAWARVLEDDPCLPE